MFAGSSYSSPAACPLAPQGSPDVWYNSRVKTKGTAAKKPPADLQATMRGGDTTGRVAICLGLAVATLAVYARTLGNGFLVYDDQIYITDNPTVKAGLTLEGLRWAFTTGHSANWHPLTWLSHMLDWQFYGAGAGMHHLTSLLLHIASAIMLFFVLERMTGRRGPSAFVAAAFALHPLHVESVAWAAERKDVLSGLFWILTMGAWALYVERPGRGRYAAALSLFVLGLMAKPMIVSLPFVLLLLDFWPLGRWRPSGAGSAGDGRDTARAPTPGRALILEKLPFFALALVSSVVTYLVQTKWGSVLSVAQYSMPMRFANALVCYVRYLIKTVWPAGLAPFYPYPPSWAVWQVLGALVMLVGVTFLALRASRRHPWLITGWFWYLGTLVPVIGLVQVGRQSMADRYSYIPLIGIFIVVAWEASGFAAARRLPKAVLPAAAAVALAAASVVTYVQAGYWKDTITLFNHTLAVTRDNPVAHNVLGNYLAKQQKFDEAIAHLREAMRIIPDEETATHLGLALAIQGKFAEAEALYREALRLNPGYVEAHVNLAETLHRKGRGGEALVHYAEAVRAKGGDGRLRTNYAACLAENGRTEDAIAQYREAIRVAPGYAEAHNNLGAALLGLGRNAEALDEFTRALALKPDFADARFNRGAALFREGRYEDATAEFGALLKLRPGDPAVESALRSALARTGGSGGAPAAGSNPRRP